MAGWRPFVWLIATFFVLVAVNFLRSVNVPQLIAEVGYFAAWLPPLSFDSNIFVAAWGRHLRDAVVALAVLASAAGLGMAGLRWINADAEASGEFGLTAAGLGLGIVGLLVLGLGMCGLFFPSIAAVPVIAGIFVVGRGWPGIRRTVKSGSRAVGWLRDIVFANREAVWLGAALVVMAVVCLIYALGPEAGWDPMYYHLRLPRLYEMRHKIYLVPYIYPSHYPQGIEMLFGLGWLLGGEGAAKLINLSFWPLCGAALFQLAKPFGARTAFRSVALALTLPIVGTLAAESYIDLGVTFFTLLALIHGSRGRYVAAGVFLGFGMGAKYTGVIPAAALAAAALMCKGRFGGLVRMAAVAALPVLPWLFKNGLFTGDPVAPFFYGVLGTADWAGGIDQQAMVAVIPELLPNTGFERARSLLASLWGFLNHNRFAVFSPFLFCALPFLIWRTASRLERRLKWYVIMFTLAVLVLCPDGRYWQPVVFPLSILAAVWWERSATAGVRFSRAAVSTAALACVFFGVIYHILDMRRTLPGVARVAVGFLSRERYEERMVWPRGYSKALDYLHANVPEGERILVVSEVQAYRIDREAVFDCDAPQARRWITRLVERSDASEMVFVRQMRQWNARTILYLRPRAVALARDENWGVKAVRMWSRFWNSRFRPVYRSGSCVIYEFGASGTGLGRPGPDLPGPQGAAVSEIARARGLDEKRRSYAKSLRRGIVSAYVHATFGIAASRAGNYAEALAALTKATGIDRDHAVAWYGKVVPLWRMGQRSQAREALARAVALDPGNAAKRRLEALVGKGI